MKKSDRPPAGELRITIPCNRSFRGEAVAVLQAVKREQTPRSRRDLVLERLLAGVALAPWGAAFKVGSPSPPRPSEESLELMREEAKTDRQTAHQLAELEEEFDQELEQRRGGITSPPNARQNNTKRKVP